MRKNARQVHPNESKTYFETFSGVHNKSEKKLLGSHWRIRLCCPEPLTKSALMQFSRPHNLMRQQDPIENTTSHERTQSPQTNSSEILVGSRWRTEIIKVKGQIFPICCIFAPP